jgi:hypothetical protein
VRPRVFTFFPKSFFPNFPKSVIVFGISRLYFVRVRACALQKLQFAHPCIYPRESPVTPGTH